MDNVTRFCALTLCLAVYLGVAYLLYWIAETWDKHSQKKSAEKIEIRRKEFNIECERAGKDMMLHDELLRIKQGSVQSQPIRKAVGYFSDEFAQTLVQ